MFAAAPKQNHAFLSCVAKIEVKQHPMERITKNMSKTIRDIRDPIRAFLCCMVKIPQITSVQYRHVKMLSSVQYRHVRMLLSVHHFSEHGSVNIPKFTFYWFRTKFTVSAEFPSSALEADAQVLVRTVNH